MLGDENFLSVEIRNPEGWLLDSADGAVGEAPEDGGVFSVFVDENLEEMLLSHDPRRDGSDGGIGAVWPVPLVNDGELVVCGSEGWWWWWTSGICGMWWWWTIMTLGSSFPEGEECGMEMVEVEVEMVDVEGFGVEFERERESADIMGRGEEQCVS